MALTIANYLYKELVPGDWKIHMDVCNMEVVKSLIAKKGSKEPQLIRVTATTDLSTGQAELRYASVNAEGRETSHHATCTVKYGGGEEWLSEWSQIAYLVKGRIRSLQKSVSKGIAQRLSRGTTYKLFSALVAYSEKYRGIEEVIVDAPELEATSVVNFQTTEKDGNFFCSPYWIDSLAHLSGFIMNGTDAVDPSAVYVSHGWRNMRFSEAFNTQTTYRSYVKMQEAGKDVVAGDIYILRDETIVGLVGGLKFQRIPRRVLDTLLPPDNGRTASRATPNDALPATVAATRRPADSRPADKATMGAPASNPVIPAAKLNAASKKAAPRAANRTASKAGGNSVVTAAMALVAAEAEVDPAELQDECVFADIGIDSLLSLTITGKLREELALDVPGDLFLKFPIVKALKAQLASFEKGDAAGEADEPEPEPQHKLEPEPIVQQTSQALASTPSEGTSTPWTMMSSSTSEADDSYAPAELGEDGADDDLLDHIKATISDQMGMSVEEISGPVELASLGMDSLMTISILGSLREQTGANLPGSFFIDYPTINDVERFLKKSKAPGRPPAAAAEAVDDTTYPKAVSILLQGNPKTAEKTLFLIPDGSGSATSYTTIPTIGKEVALFGLNCPYMTTPKDFKCGIEKIAELFLDEVKRRQPNGPYYLGGWSAGGVIAYQMTLHLAAEGQRVENLLLFDSPCPVKLEALPHRLHQFFGSIGLLGSGGRDPPEWLLPHFEASVRALTEYKPVKINPKFCPKTLAIWATDGVCKNPSDPRPPPQSDDPKSMKWLLDNRTDFGYNGWDQILSSDSITTTKVGANHFTMMREPQASPMDLLDDHRLTS